MADTTSVGDYNIFGQPLILSSSSRPNWADLAIERAAEIERLRTEIERLRVLLAQANDAFDECTGDYQKELVADEPWRQYGGER